MMADIELRFIFRLALHMGCTVNELLNRITSAELTCWFAYAGVEPFGEERADLRSAIVASTVATCWTGKQHHAKDFMPNFAPRQQSWQDVKAYFVRLSKQ